MIPVSEVQISYNMPVELNLCFLCYKESPSQGSSIRRKHVMLRIQLPFSILALFVRNRANVVAVFEGSPIRYNKAAFHLTNVGKANSFPGQ